MEFLLKRYGRMVWRVHPTGACCDETVINPYYMEQLMQYVLDLGARYGADMDRAQMRSEGLVRFCAFGDL